MDYNSLGTKLEFLRARMQNTDELVSVSNNAGHSLDFTSMKIYRKFSYNIEVVCIAAILMMREGRVR